MRIELKPVELSAQRNMDLQELFIELTPTYIRYRGKFTAEEPNNDEDHALGWRTFYRDFDWRIYRAHTTSIDKVFSDARDVWKIILTVNGSNTDIELFFDLQSECEAAYEILCNYLFGEVCIL